MNAILKCLAAALVVAVVAGGTFAARADSTMSTAQGADAPNANVQVAINPQPLPPGEDD